jgi:hypothetical protein
MADFASFKYSPKGGSNIYGHMVQVQDPWANLLPGLIGSVAKAGIGSWLENYKDRGDIKNQADIMKMFRDRMFGENSPTDSQLSRVGNPISNDYTRENYNADEADTRWLEKILAKKGARL